MKKRALTALAVSFLTLAVMTASLAGCGEKVKEAWAQLPDYSEAKQLAAALSVMLQSSTYESTETIQAAWTDVEDAYEDLVKAVDEKKDVAGEKITNLEEAFNSLDSAVSSLTSDMTPQEKLNKVKAAVMEVEDLVQ